MDACHVVRMMTMYDTSASAVVAALHRSSEPSVHPIVIESEIENPHSCMAERGQQQSC